MNDVEREAVFFIADISGYTKFIFSNEKEAAHSQIIIRELITAILDEVRLPLKLVRIEGDALFLYALKDNPEKSWDRLSKDLVFNMMTFFEVFANKVSELSIHKIFNCTACNNLEQLKLKIVVHSGRAAFYKVNEHQELTGKDAIIVHRLLKNSIDSDESILLTEPAYQELRLPAGDVEQSEEIYEDIGTITIYVYYPPAPEPYIPIPDAKPPMIFIETLRTEISHEYAKVAQYPELGFHFHTARRLAPLLEYQEVWFEGIPEVVIESFAGTGNPFNLGNINPGEKVLDLGCGAGLDCLIASKMVGDEGEVIGVDMTAEMIDKAKSNAQLTGSENVTFMKGFIEDLSLPDGWSDVAISNGARKPHTGERCGIQGTE